MRGGGSRRSWRRRAGVLRGAATGVRGRRAGLWINEELIAALSATTDVLGELPVSVARLAGADLDAVLSVIDPAVIEPQGQPCAFPGLELAAARMNEALRIAEVWRQKQLEYSFRKRETF